MVGGLLQAILFACGLLAVGLTLRAGVPWLRALFVPASVLAGAVGFAVAQGALRWEKTAAVTAGITKELSTWPGVLIAVVFAGLLLERSSGKGFGEALRRGARSGLLAWIIILGQIVIGLLVFVVAVRPWHAGVTPSFGQLLEVSWAGGHGTSSAMGDIYRGLGFREGRDIAFFLATMGLVYGVISGLLLVNLGIRRGWTRTSADGTIRGRIPVISGLEPRHDSPPIAFAKTRGEVMEPLALQVVILAAAFGVGYGLQQGFISLSSAMLGAKSPLMQYLGNIPLFLFTLLGGWAVRAGMQLARIDDLIDSASVQRLVGVSMEFLIVAALTTLRVEALGAFVLPITLLLLGGAAWSIFCLLFLSPRLLPRAYWFELGLLNFGFSTANTPQGMMLLRIIDPDLKSGAAEDYAVAAPLSAPFIGGGVLTVAGLPWLLANVRAEWVIGALLLVMAFLFAIGRKLAMRQA